MNNLFFKNSLLMKVRNLKAEEDLGKHAATRIKNVTTKAQGNIRHALKQGMIDGNNPLQIALDIAGRIDPVSGQRAGGIIGLYSHDLEMIALARHYLLQLDRRYLLLKLRDKRFDRTFKKSIEEAKPVPKARMERIISAYSNRLLQRRAEIIARTETLQSINRSNYAANLKLLEEGLLNRNAITKEWDDCGDKKVRRSHAEMAQRYGKGNGIPIDEPFVLPSGAKMLYPGDQSLGAPAKEIIQCRCRANYRVNWLAGI